MQLKPTTSLIDPFGVQFDLAAGIMHNPTDHIVRRASAMCGYYADAAALEKLIADENDPAHYETFESPVPEEYGHMRYCISKLHPGLVGEECFMTKGHYHTTVETGEVYLCLRGQGLAMMKTARRRDLPAIAGRSLSPGAGIPGHRPVDPAGYCYHRYFGERELKRGGYTGVPAVESDHHKDNQDEDKLVADSIGYLKRIVAEIGA